MNCLLDLIIVIITLIILFLIVYIFQYKYEELDVMFTPRNIFKRNYEQFDKEVKLGMKNISNFRVVICGLIRNGSKNLPSFIQKCENLCSYFKDYRVLIVENDSRDNTRDILLQWSKINPKVVILGCGINSPECKLNIPKTNGGSISKTRIGKMVKLRNIYLDYIKKYLRDFDYGIVWDVDLLGSVYFDGILNSFGKFQKDENIDCICANGLRRFFRNFVYYDNYAHVLNNETYHENNENIHVLKVLLNTTMNKNNPNLVKVNSCFGGFSIYKIPSLLKSNYSSDLDGSIECEHTGLHSNMDNVYYNPMMINLVLKNPK